MLDLEVLIFKLLPIDGFAPCAVASGEISTLQHKLFDDSMEGRSLTENLSIVVPTKSYCNAHFQPL